MCTRGCYACAQAVEKTRTRPIGIKWVDVKKADGRHRTRVVAKEVNDGIDQAMYVATLPLAAQKLDGEVCVREQERTCIWTAPADDNSSIMIHLDMLCACFHAQARPNTYMEVPDEDQTEEATVCGCSVQGHARNEASGVSMARGGG